MTGPAPVSGDDSTRARLAEKVMDNLPHSGGCLAHGGVCLCAVPRAKRAVAIADALLPVVEAIAVERAAEALEEEAGAAVNPPVRRRLRDVVPVSACLDCGGHGGHFAHCDRDQFRPPASSAGQDTERLRDEIAAWLQQRYAPPGPFGFATRDWRIEANDLLREVSTIGRLVAERHKITAPPRHITGGPA